MNIDECRKFHWKSVVVVDLCNNLGLFRDVLAVWKEVVCVEQTVETRQEALEQKLAEVSASVALMSDRERRLAGKIRRWSSICRTLRQQTSEVQALPAVQPSHPVGRYIDLEL